MTDQYKLGNRSRKNLEGVHHVLVDWVKQGIKDSPIDFTVIEGLRTRERQKQLVASGASRTMNSRHLTGHAVDIAPLDPNTGKISWAWPHYDILSDHLKTVSEDMGLGDVIEWGGDWKSFKDGPHWQLSRKAYPA